MLRRRNPGARSSSQRGTSASIHACIHSRWSRATSSSSALIAVLPVLLALRRLVARAEERQRILHALQLLLAGEGPGEGVLGLVVHGLGREHAPRPGDARE